MHTIGTTENGSTIVEVSSVELEVMRALKQVMGIVRAFSQPLAPIQPAPAPTHTPAPKAKRPAKTPRAAPAHKPATAPAAAGNRICLACGKPFAVRRKDQTCCNPVCRNRVRNRNRASVASSPKHAAPAAPAKPDRLAALRAAAARLQERDPLALAADKARTLAAEDAGA